MKRTILLIISCFVLLNYVSAKSFKDKSDIVKEIDSNHGKLCTVIYVRNEEVFNNNIESLIRDNLDILSFCLPDISSLKDSMVTRDYIKEHYPKFYSSPNGSKIEDKVGYDFTILTQILDDTSGIVAIRHNDKYIGYALYIKGGLVWYYTKEVLSMMELISY